ncbi:MAG TPA: UDP-N-acetylmuramoyl-tripeptide--D-alanyl-D-alanine ligase, partial [Synergistaceae bacterium]|nr:UDP-N-acetylmuramoyl-tripeptide--D-alanyl-D-alanine ligase [Synergistaceae bacterium]
MERGAKLLLVDISRVEELMLDEPEFSGVSVIAVQDTATALPVIARDYLKRVSPRLTGITGSVGKTTTRELTVSLLKTEKKVHSAIKSFNTVVGCSLTILAMAEDTEVLVLEFGTNHFGEIREMVSLFPPETAVITEVAPAHLEGFENIEGVLRAKMEICESKMLDTIIYNSDNMLLGNELSYKYNNINKIGVGKCAGADLKITDQKLSLDDGGAALASFYDFMGKSVELRANLFGLQHSYNVGYAFLTALHYGISEDAVQEAL